MKQTPHRMWELDLHKLENINIDSAQQRRYLLTHKCRTCGATRDDNVASFDPVMIAEPEIKKRFGVIGILRAYCWEEDLFTQLAPYYPRHVRWNMVFVDEPWHRSWVACTIDPELQIYEIMDGVEWKRCSVCGEKKATKYERKYAIRASDACNHIVDASMHGLLVSDEVKNLPIWRTVSNLRFHPVTVL